MPSPDQNDQHKPRRRPRKPKIKSRRSGQGGDHRSLKFQREQSRIDSEVYRMVCEGFQLAQAAAALGISEDAAGPAYRRAISGLRLATIEEAKGQAIDRIHYRRKILYAEIQKRLKANGSDPKKLFDSADLRMLFDAAHQLDVRESKLVGLDAPLRSLIGWTGIAPSEDLLTVGQLDNLDDRQLRQLFELLKIARSGKNGAVEVESRAIATDGYAAAPVIMPPEPQKLPVVESAPVPPALASRPEWDEITRRESTERYAPLREAEAMIAKLDSTDPITRESDPVVRRELAKQANEILIRFGRQPWKEWQN